MLVVVRTVHAREIQLACFVRFPVFIDCKPTGVLVIKLFVCAVGIHACEHGESIFVCGAAEVAEQVFVL